MVKGERSQKWYGKGEGALRKTEIPGLAFSRGGVQCH